MPLRLERLIYESTATGSTGSLTNLAAILAESQRNNARDGLTGALAAHRDRYVQVVEGPADTLDGLLRRLGGDGRHRDIRLLDRRPIEARRFADWTMASARITPELAVRLDAVLAAANERPGEVAELLHQAVG